MGKSSVVGIAKGHFRTLRDARTGRVRVFDLVWQVGLPVACGVVCAVFGWHLDDASNAIVGISIVAALMCAMAALIFQIRLDLNKAPVAEKRDVALIDEVFANVMWAILMGLALALYLIAIDAVGLFDGGTSAIIASSVAVALCVHFVFVIGMCLKRFQRSYERIAASKQ